MNEKIRNIFLRSLREDISFEDQMLLDQWANENPENQAMLDELRDPQILAGYLKQMERYDAEKAWQKISASKTSEEQTKKTSPIILRRLWAAAAVFLLVGSAVTFYLLQRQPVKDATTIYAGDVQPGRDGAKIRLSNGVVVTIDTLKDGLISSDGRMRIYKEKGQIIYRNNNDVAIDPTAVAYNEIIVDKGRKTMAALPDGSTVWVNAGSSVRYPLHFDDKERLVSMTGEASFLVVHNSKQPFRVKVKDQLVEDIGTEFNINAYDDEPIIRTTMVEGLASVSAGSQKIILKQGQESQNKDGQLLSAKADIEKAIAWRNGLFSFDHADLKTVLRQFTRWYDVEVQYEANIPQETFTGEMERNLTLNDALDNLKRMGVRFRIEEDKRIVVLP